MHRFLAGVFVTLALAAGGSTASRAEVPVQTIYVQNLSTNLTDAAVLDALPVFQQATSHDFARYWGIDTQLVYVGRNPVPAGSWHIDLMDSAHCIFCSGFHFWNGSVPYAQVATMGDDWQVTFTHELFEMLADPWGNRATVAGKRILLEEVGDPVEGTQFAYTRRSPTGKRVHISDFVLPSWFRPGSKGQHDFTRHTKRALQVLKDGYQLVWRNGAWTWPSR